jgi:hypothetical protein
MPGAVFYRRNAYLSAAGRSLLSTIAARARRGAGIRPLTRPDKAGATRTPARRSMRAASANGTRLRYHEHADACAIDGRAAMPPTFATPPTLDPKQPLRAPSRDGTFGWKRTFGSGGFFLLLGSLFVSVLGST